MLRDKMNALLTSDERALFRTLNSPQKIQDFLDALPINFEECDETYLSPRRMLREQKAHCLEGAVFAAAVIAYHGGEPLLMDIQTAPDDEDHVVTLFRQHGRWGAISKTNHAILRYRDPVYASVRELAMSYFNEYFLNSGRKTMRAYSKPFRLDSRRMKSWLTDEDAMALEWIAEAIDESQHFPVADQKNYRVLRNAHEVERGAMLKVQWEEPAVYRARYLDE